MRWVTALEGGPRRVNHAAALVGHKIYSFGGFCMDEDSNDFRPIDVHVLNTVTCRWKALPVEEFNLYTVERVPFQRYGHTAIAYHDKIYIWGGRNDTTACNVLYCFDTTTHTWSAPPTNGNTIPGARDGHSACIHKNEMYIFGGFEEDEEMFSQDVFKLNLDTMTWSYVATFGEPPLFRDFHTSIVLNEKMYIFGGRSNLSPSFNRKEEVYCPEIVYLDLKTRVWIRPYTSGMKPIGRRSHSAFEYNGFMYIFGGYNGILDEHFNDLYRFNPNKNEWQLVRAHGKPPNKRRRQCCIVYGDRMFLFGGTSPKLNVKKPLIVVSDLERLVDNSDLHVLDFNPSLLTLVLISVINNNLDISCLPRNLRDEISCLRVPNTISRPCAGG